VAVSSFISTAFGKGKPETKAITIPPENLSQILDSYTNFQVGRFVFYIVIVSLVFFVEFLSNQ